MFMDFYHQTPHNCFLNLDFKRTNNHRTTSGDSIKVPLMESANVLMECVVQNTKGRSHDAKRV